MSIYKRLKSRNESAIGSSIMKSKKRSERLEGYLRNSDFAAVAVSGVTPVTLGNYKKPVKRRKRNKVNIVSPEYTVEEVLNKTFFKSLNRLSKLSCSQQDFAVVDLGMKAIAGQINQIFGSAAYPFKNFDDVYSQVSEMLKRCNKGKEVPEVSKYIFCQLSNMMTTNGGDILNAGYRGTYDLSDRFNEGVSFFNKIIAADTLALEAKKTNKRLGRLEGAASSLESFYDRTPKVRSQSLIKTKIEIKDELKVLQSALDKSWGLFTKRGLRSKIKNLNFELARNDQEIHRVSKLRGGGSKRLRIEFNKSLFDERVLEYEGLNGEISELESLSEPSKKSQKQRIINRLQDLEVAKYSVLREAATALYNINPVKNRAIVASPDRVMKSIEDRSIAMDDEYENSYPRFLSTDMVDIFNDRFSDLLDVYQGRETNIPKIGDIDGGLVKAVELTESIREFIESDEFKTLGIDYVKDFYPDETGLARLLEKSVKINSCSNEQLIGYFSQASQNPEYKGSFKYFCRDEFKTRLQDARFRNELVSFVNKDKGITATSMFFTLAKEFDLPDVDHFLDIIYLRGVDAKSPIFEYLDCAKAIFSDIAESFDSGEPLSSMKVLGNISKMQKLKLIPEDSRYLNEQLRNILPIEKSKPVAEKFVQLLDFCKDITASKPEELSSKYFKEIGRQQNENDSELSPNPVDKFKLQFIRDVSSLKNNEYTDFRRRYTQPSHQEVKAQHSTTENSQSSALTNRRIVTGSKELDQEVTKIGSNRWALRDISNTRNDAGRKTGQGNYQKPPGDKLHQPISAESLLYQRLLVVTRV